jgi:hypothetical protein
LATLCSVARVNFIFLLKKVPENSLKYAIWPLNLSDLSPIHCAEKLFILLLLTNNLLLAQFLQLFFVSSVKSLFGYYILLLLQKENICFIIEFLLNYNCVCHRRKQKYNFLPEMTSTLKFEMTPNVFL